jgi:hypothetical protein
MERIVIARWESRRGKDWVEVYEQCIDHMPIGYGYTFRNGAGWMGPIPRELALETVRKKVAAGVYCSQKSPMRKVV